MGRARRGRGRKRRLERGIRGKRRCNRRVDPFDRGTESAGGEAGGQAGGEAGGEDAEGSMGRTTMLMRLSLTLKMKREGVCHKVGRSVRHGQEASKRRTMR